MSAPVTKGSPTRPRKEREREKEKEKERKEKPGQQVNERLKTVIRRLPPNLPEDIFWQSVEKWITDEDVSWKTFYPGKLRKKLNKENIPSRAYIAFKTEEKLAQFGQEYDGHLFRDKTGNEYQAVVEFAPYQKVPTDKKKPDARNATIEKDEDYISFLESLNAPPQTESLTLEALIASTRPPSPPKTTPLLEALKAEKSLNKDKEIILRNHAHYKDTAISGISGSRKEELKKKAQKMTEASLASTTGKKAPKKPHSQAQAQAQPSPAPPQSLQSHKPVSKGAPGPSNPQKPPRAPKAPLPKAPKPSAINTSIAAAAAASGTVATVDTPVASATSTLDPTASSSSPAPPRRARPVIGLASRQFEAALSGVVGVTSTGERKSRREREREREERRGKEKEASTPIAQIDSSAVAPTDKLKSTPPSPRKDRNTRRGGAGTSTASNVTNEPQVKVPSILQRMDTPTAGSLQQEFPRNGDGNVAVSAQGQAQLVGEGGMITRGHGSRGGRRGGRGRGTGTGTGVPKGN